MAQIYCIRNSNCLRLEKLSNGSLVIVGFNWSPYNWEVGKGDDRLTLPSFKPEPNAPHLGPSRFECTFISNNAKGPSVSNGLQSKADHTPHRWLATGTQHTYSVLYSMQFIASRLEGRGAVYRLLTVIISCAIDSTVPVFFLWDQFLSHVHHARLQRWAVFIPVSCW
jgi:hypothetical protein